MTDNIHEKMNGYTQEQLLEVIETSHSLTNEGWNEGNLHSGNNDKDAKSLVEIIYRLYFVEGKTQQEVTKILGYKSTQPIRRIFREQGWTPRYSQSQVIPRGEIDDKSVRSLYFDKGLTLQEVATKLGTSLRVIRQIFHENGWATRGVSRNQQKPDTLIETIIPQDEDDLERIVYDLYYNQNLSQRRIANILGYKSISPIQRIFRENNWEVRSITGSRAKHRIFTNDEERRAAVKEHGEKTRKKIVDLRERLFGTKCKICGVSKEDEKTIAIHRKDGALHDYSELWRIKFLKSLNPEEWVALCVRCHRGVHWIMNNLDKTWRTVEACLSMKITNIPSKRKCLELPSNTAISSDQYEKIKPTFHGTPEELKRVLFGGNCHYCGNDYGKRRLVLHRKDGTHHHSRLTEREKYFRTLNPKEWVTLCQKCHVYVHWGMNSLSMGWNDLKKEK